MPIVAKITGKENAEYDSLINAYKEAVDGDTIVLEADDSTADFLEIQQNSVTLDLNGHSFTSAAPKTAVVVHNNAHLTVTDSSDNQSGKIVSSKGQGIGVGSDAYPNGSSLTFNAGNVESQETGIAVFGSSKLEFNSGTVHSKDNAAIATSGKAAFKDMHYDITINGGQLVAGTTSAGYANCGLYLANNGSCVVNGGTITSEKGAGIVVRAGDLKVTGGTIDARGTDLTGLRMGDANPTFCGGIEVNNSSNYPGTMGTTLVTGGSVSSKANAAVLVIGDPAATSNTHDSKVVIKDGTFDGQLAINYVSADGKDIEDPTTAQVSVLGGTFNASPEKFVDASKLTRTVDDSGNTVYEVLDSLQTVSKNVKKLVDASDTRDKTLADIYNRLNRDFDQDTDNTENIEKLVDITSQMNSTGQATLETTQSIKETVESINEYSKSLDASNSKIDTTTDKTYQDVETIKTTTNKVLTELNELNSSMIQLLDLNQKILVETAKLLGDDQTLSTQSSKTLKQIYEEQINYHIQQAKADQRTEFVWNHTMNDDVKAIFESKGCKVSQPENLGGMYLITLA